MKKFLFILLFILLSVTLPSALADQPCPGHEKCGKEGCYWCTPMDITDEEAVWKMLCSPITVIDGNQKDQYLLRSEPNANSAPVADVTYASQGVHVLENLDNGWSRVETRSSSFNDSSVKAYNTFVTGYVETALLKEIVPNNSNYAIVIDKMTQRCYIFREGKLFSTLLISTGKANSKQPYNETQSGEFLIVSPTGDFNSDELVCEMGLRFNRGNLLHQVPYVLTEDGIKDFSRCESALGTRASHGCVRVQRKATPEGTNMTWLWNNRKMNSKLVIWEDCTDRYFPLPEHDTIVYINASGGKTYHRLETCPSVADRYLPLKAIPYLDLLNTENLSLKPCACCVPLARPETYVEMNKTYASSEPVYLDSMFGAYYHWDPYCSLYDEQFLPLHPASDAEIASPSFSFYAPCPLCIVKAQNPTLYYNPLGGKRYHSDPNCSSVNKRYLPMPSFEYCQLDDEEFASLVPCTKCNPPKRGLHPTNQSGDPE